MSAWKRICCPVDFSAASSSALKGAVELASWSGASLTLLHVDERPPLPTPDATLIPPEALRRAAVERDRQLAAWREAAARSSGGPVAELLVTGDPAAEIVRAAAEGRHDVIVMGTHGRSGRAEAPVGSVAQKVILDAPCPVVVIRSEPSRERAVTAP